MITTAETAYTAAAAFLAAHGAPPASIEPIAQRVAKLVTALSHDALTLVVDLPNSSLAAIIAANPQNADLASSGIVPPTELTVAAIQVAAEAVINDPRS